MFQHEFDIFELDAVDLARVFFNIRRRGNLIWQFFSLTGKLAKPSFRFFSVWCTLFKAPAKRSQRANTTYRNIVGRNMLRAFGHRVAMRCDMLALLAQV